MNSDADGFKFAKCENPPPSPLLSLVVVIPAYAEPNLEQTLQSLMACNVPSGQAIEVLVVINHGEGVSENDLAENERGLQLVKDLERISAGLDRCIRAVDARGLPERIAGVGTARKIGMDLAIERLRAAAVGDQGVIVNLDADCTVDANYFEAIVEAFANPKLCGASLYFEHPISGAFAPQVYEAVTQYELFLRYYVNALRWAGHPYAFQTVGSAMAVRAKTYLQEGGMNRRKAAEDFYFLQKIIARQWFRDLCSTCVYPSPRPSDRVPFGTGRTIRNCLNGEMSTISAYSPQVFFELRQLFANFSRFYEISGDDNWLGQLPALAAYWNEQCAMEQISRIRSNCASLPTFRAKFLQWFNLFRCRQFAHFARDRFYPNIAVSVAVRQLFPDVVKNGQNATELLTTMRQQDRKNPMLLGDSLRQVAA